MANTTIKITQLQNIGNGLAGNTLLPVVNTTGTAITQKVTVGNVANFVLGQAGNTLAPAFLSTLAYSVANAAQPNITSVGTLSINTLKISGGTNGYVIQTDGSGNLSWTAQTGNAGNGTPGGSNTQVQFNDAGAFGGNTGFTFNKTTGIFTSPFLAGNGNGLSNIQGANVSGLGNIATANFDGNTSNVLHGDGTWSADQTTYGNSNVVTLLSAFGSNTITTTGNISGGNLVTGGQVVASGNVSSGTGLTTGGFLSVDGNTDLHNTIVTGNLSATGNITASYVLGNGSQLTNIAGANVGGFVPNANVANTAFAVAVANVVGIGNIATLSLSGSTSNVLYGNGVFAAVPAPTVAQDITSNGAMSIMLYDGNIKYNNYATVEPSSGNIAGGNISANGNISGGNISATGNITANNLGNISSINIDGSNTNVLYGNGVFAAVAGGNANTGNVTFDDNIVIGTGDEFGGDGLFLAPGNGSIANSAVQYLRVRGGDYPTHIHLDTGNNQYYDQYFGADSRFVKLEATGNVVINADDYNGNGATWTLDTTGNLTLAGGNSVIQSIANSSLDPVNPNVSTMVLTPDQGYNAQSLVLDPTAPGHIHLRAPGSNIDEPLANIFLGGEDSSFEVGYYNGSAPNVFIHSGGNTWTFSNDGTTTFPTGNITSNTSLQFTTTFANYRTVEYQTAGVWDVYVDDTTTGPNDAWSWINVTFKDNLIDKPEVFIENQKANDGIAQRWTFDENGNLNFPRDVAGNTDPYLNIFGGSTPTIQSTDVSLAGPANLAIQSDYLNLSGSTGNRIAIYADNGEIGTEANMVLYTNLANPGNIVSWILDTTGNLTLPNTSSVLANVSITLEANDTGNITGLNLIGDSNANLYAHGNVTIVSDSSNTTATWAFGADGNLTLPGNTFAVNYANGTQVSIGGGGNTGNVTFNDINIIGTGNLKLQPDSANANAYLDIFLTAGPDIHIAGNGETVILGTDDYANVAVNIDGNVSIQAGNVGGTQTWNFGTDGNLTLPGNLVIAGNTSVFGTDAALIQTTDNRPLLALSSGANGAVSSLWVEDIGNVGTSNIAAVYANPTVGSGIVRIAVGQNGGNTGPNLWDFGTTGILTLPQGSQISETANTSVNITANANTWAFGVDGNLTVPGSIINDTSIVLSAPAVFNICTIATAGSGYNTGSSLKATTGGSGTGMTVGIGYGLSNQLTSVSVVNPGTGYVNGDVITVSEGTGGTFVITKYNVLANQTNNNTVQTDLIFANNTVTLPIYGKMATDASMTLTTNLANAGNTSSWTFGTTGNLTLPTGGHIIVSGGIVGSGASPAPYISGFDSISALEFTNGTSNVTVTANASSWTFGTNGNLTLPEGGIVTNNIPPVTFDILYQYDDLEWDGITVTFTNASSTYMLGVLALMQAGDPITLVGPGGPISTTVAIPYTGGSAGYFTVTEANSPIQITQFTLPNRLTSVTGIKLTTNAKNYLFTEAGVTQSPVLTVDTLPSGQFAVAGFRAFVSDANLAPVGNFGAIVGNSGANTVCVWCDGTDWRIG